MSTIVQFKTLNEMYDRIMDRYRGSDRFILRSKVNGLYCGMKYEEMESLVGQCACGFADLGIRRGDRVGLISENRPEWIITDFALMQIGAINVSVYPTLSVKQIEFIFLDAGVEYAIVSNPVLEKKILQVREAVSSLKKIIHFFEDENSSRHVVSLRELMKKGEKFARDNPAFLQQEKNKTTPEDILTLIYTSGTTGNPKGVILTHRNLVSNIIASAESIPFNDDDNILSFLPLCHSYERMAGYYAAMACGVDIAYAESVDKVFENLAEVRPTVVTTVPRLFERMYQRLMKRVNGLPVWRKSLFHWSVRVGKQYHHKRKRGKVFFLTSLQYRWAEKVVLKKIRERIGGRIRFFVSGGAALSSDVGEFFEALGILILEGYGMTETSPVISFNRPDRYKFGTVGIPIPNVEVRISDQNEILVRGPNVMKGYWHNEAATRESIDAGGWLHTGDIGRFDDDGFLVITDRLKHLFVSSGGKNIAPQHIESLFSQHYLIEQFILIGDGRRYLTAIIEPNFDAVREIASGMGFSTMNMTQAVQHDKVYRYFEHEINRIQKDLARYERVRKFVLLDHALTIEEGELTPSLKVKRRIVEERYKNLIDKMYEGSV